MKIKIAYLVLITSILTNSTFAADPAMFFAPNDYSQAKLSPDGKHFALTAEVDGAEKLAIVETGSRQPVALFRTQKNRGIYDFWWANSERVVFSQSISRGWLDYPLLTGELFALNIDNKKKFAIAGWAAGDGYGAYEFLHRRPADKKRIQVVRRAIKNNSIQQSRPTAHTLDTYRRPRQQTGTNLVPNSLKDRIISPYPWGSFIADNDGEIRLAWYINEKGFLKVSYRGDGENTDWQELAEFTSDQAQLALDSPIVSFDPNNTGFYYLGNGNHNTASLFHFDLNSREATLLYEHEAFDIREQDLVIASDHEIIGINFLGAFPEAHFFSQHPEATLFNRLQAAFPDQRVNITSRTEDGKLLLIDVRSDVNPGTLYTFDLEAKQARPLLHRTTQIDPNQMQNREPFKLRNSDGMDIYGFVTRARSDNPASPLLIIPHGGPHGVMDTFLYDNEAQFFASAGFTVVQINFRGSGGYGSALRNAGIRQWATGMIDDILLATRWALQQGYGAADKVCIYGGSYGAFAALSAAIQAPDMFRCAAGYAGVYDLTIMEDSDISFLPSGKSYLRTVLGTDMARLKSESPVYNAEKIQIPVFIAHGGEDQRAPIAHANAMTKALTEANKPFELLIEPDEGHGFFDTEHRINFYTRLLAFVQKHTRD